MDNNTLLQIVGLCLEIDELAVDIYRNLAMKTEQVDLKTFWNHMSDEESRHVACWRELLKLVEDKIIPQIFHHPEKTLAELHQIRKRILPLSEQSTSRTTITDCFVMAFRLEFYLLHPALEQLWNFYGIIQHGKYNPEHDYENHVQEFIRAMRKFGSNTTELEALAEALERMWVNTKSMAHEASFDELTNVLNRRGLFNSMTSLAYLAKRNKFNSAVIMIDIDHFKRINDTFGHQTGDKV